MCIPSVAIMEMHITGTQKTFMYSEQKPRHGRKLNPAACLGPAYYLNCIFGLFPGRYDFHKHKHLEESDVNYIAPFYKTRFAKSVGFSLWAYLTVGFIISNCRQMDLAEWINFICITICFTSIYYFCLIHSSDEIVDCFNTGFQLLQSRRHTDNNYFGEIVFIFFPIVKAFVLEAVLFYFQWSLKLFLIQSAILLVIMAELCMYSCIMTFCLAAQIVFDDINKRLSSIKRYAMAKEINDLMRLHWRAGEFADNLSKCFGGIALVTTIHNLLRFVVLFVKLGNWFLTPNKTLNGPAMYSCIHCIKIAWIFISICVRSQRMTSKALQAKDHLQRIMCGVTLSEETMEVMYLFKVQTGLREICLSARGCFKYNMKTVLMAGNIVVAYIVAIIQMK